MSMDLLTVRGSTMVMGLYGVLLLSRILVLTGNYNWPINPVIIELIYIIICFAILLFTSKGKIKLFPTKMMLVFTILIFHTIIWGKVFVNYRFVALIESLYKSQIMFWSIILVTVLFIYKYNLLETFIKTSFFVLLLVLFVQFITNITEFDLSNIWNIMNKDKRTRANFGFGHYNALGASCICILVLSTMFSKKFTTKIRAFIYGGRILAILMLLCSASRSSITSLLVFFVIYVSVGINDLDISKRLKILIKILLAVVILSISFWVLLEVDLEDILLESQRFLIFEYALPLFLKSGRVFIGLGFASNTAYGTGLTPYTTYWIDNGYIYYLVTTGILGFLMIVGAIAVIFLCQYKMRTTSFGKKVFSLYIMYLYGSLFEVTIFMSGAIVNYIYLPIFIITMSGLRRHMIE